MNKDETDKLLIDMSGDIKVLVSRSSEHHETLYGNGQPGLVKDVILLKARNTNTVGGKKVIVAIITGVVAGVGLLINFVFELVKWKHTGD